MGDKLCAECMKLDIAQYFRKETHVFRSPYNHVRASDDAVPLKSISELRRTWKTCDLCRLLLIAQCRRYAPEQWWNPEDFFDELPESADNALIYVFSYACAEDSLDRRNSLLSNGESRDHGTERCFRLGVDLTGLPPIYTSPIEIGSIQLLHTSCGALDLQPRFHGRLLNTKRVDIKLARQWLEECETKHQDRCGHTSANNDNSLELHPQNLEVIDVERMCLVAMPEGSRYFTLSYRWSSSTQCFKTTTSNVATRRIDGSLERCWDQLPATIQDAIDCTRELGEKYVWIDAICIVQDDKDDFRRLVRQMDRIYKGSLAAIIAAPPSEPIMRQIDEPFDGEGLSGYRSRDDAYLQATATIQGLEMCVAHYSIDYTTDFAPWRSRAWTFQEELLSRRRLYFTATQLYFQCRCEVFCEDTVSEGKSLMASISHTSSLCNRSYRVQTADGSFAGYNASRPIDDLSSANVAMDYYKSMVVEYTRRKLSNQCDALIALEGVLSVLRSSMNTQFVYGLPVFCFNEALLWVIFVPLRRRDCQSNCGKGDHFPTWSWVGWLNPVSYHSNFVGDIRPEIDWFVQTMTGDVAQLFPRDLAQIFSYSDHKNVRPQISLPPNLESLIPSENLKTEDLESCSLACLSSIAWFEIKGDVVEKIETECFCWNDSDNLIIFDSDSRPVGSILMEKSWWGAIKKPSNFEFMLLSRSSTVDKVAQLDDSVFPVKEWCFLNVMLVERQDQAVRRLGLGVIHENAWVSAKPVDMFLYLK